MITLNNSKEELQESLEDAKLLLKKLRNYGEPEENLKNLKKRIATLETMIKHCK